MEQKEYYHSPWGKSLVIMSCVFTIILLGVSGIGIVTGATNDNAKIIGLFVVPLGILFGTLLFMIRGYILTQNDLLIRRLFWNTKISLANLKDVQVDPKAMSGSIRTFGNGGLFSFSGKFRNHGLGPYRALVTDLKRTVVLRFPHRIVVVSPERPDRFAEKVKTIIHS